MISNETMRAGIKGKVIATDFESFLPREGGVTAEKKAGGFMVLGPFVLETGGALETEYLYERHLVLDRDYLAPDGGEANIVPYLGLACKNDYFGPEYLEWRKGTEKWDSLRFDFGDYSARDDALYATEQRNCVFYAAAYIDCKRDYDAVISYETSGNLLYLNGELIDNKPYGRVKGIINYGNQKAITFRKGRNLLLFKIRTGYICDTIDLSMSNCAIYPVIAKAGGLGLAYPMRTGAFTGSPEAPLEVFPAFVGAFGKTAAGRVNITCGDYRQSLEAPALNNGDCAYIRLALPAGKEPRLLKVAAEIEAEGGASAAGSFEASTVAYDGFGGTEHVYSDFHFDTTYHQEQRVYALGAIHIVQNMVGELSEDPGFKAILSEVDYLHPHYSIYPKDRAVIKRMFELGRAEADCFYNQPNEMTSSPEGLVRNLVYGQLYHRDVLGRICHVYGPGDVFGHPNQLSQLCAKGGCLGVYWGKHILGLDCLFRHVSPDGTSLIHARGGTSRANALRLGVSHCHESSGTDPKVPAYPRDKNSAWMKDTLTHAQFSVMSDFHRGVNEDDEAHREKTGMPLIESCSRDISLYHAGVSLTRTDFKQANRLGENLLITAEKLAAIASLYGADYPEAALDKAWRQLLCAQHHDSITGTNNEVSFVDLMIEYREACELAANIVNRAAAYLASGVRLTGNGYPVFVFNPHPWQRKDPCLVRLPEGAAAQNHSLFDAAGREYPLQPAGQDAATAVFVPDVPAMGYKMYYLKQTETPGAVSAVENYTIENEYYRIKADPALGGGIVSVYDKKAKREVLKKGPDGPANRIAVLREVPDRMETQHEFYTTGHKMLSSDCRAEVTGEKGANFSRLTVKYAMGTVAAVKQEITLYKGVKRIDFRTVVEDYQDSDDLFTVTFPVDVRGARPVFDDRFAPAVRGESNKKLEFQTHQNAMFSHCQVYAANQWLDYGPTVTLNFGGKGGVNIGMTALIRAETGELKAAAERLLEVLTKKAVPVTVYPDTSRRPYASQLVHFNEDLMNTDTRFVLSVECTPNEYEEKLLAGLKPNQRKRFDEALRQNGVAVVYVKDADNLWNKPIDVLLVKAARADGLRAFIDGLADALKTGRAARVDAIAASPLEKPDDYGVALFNSGNLACSVERGGLLNLMLFHTAEFYGNAGKTTHGAELVPEQKTHVFTYALYPHEGSYREADVYRRAFEFNDALIGATGFEPGTNRPLPESKSFLKTDRNFIVTAFKAAGYPMASMKGRFGGVAERGLTLRGFEPHGAESAARFDFGFDIGGADSVDLLDGGAVPVPSAKNSMTLRAAPHSIETLTLKAPSAGAVIGPAKLGAEHEAVEPAYVRSWEHDLGTMPMGYLAVAAVIGKKVEYIDDTSFRVEVSVANNRPDMRAKGKAFLTLPARWQADSREFPYDVAEGGCEVFPVTVTKPAPDAKGMLRLTFEDEGRLFEDVLEVGCFNPGVEAEIVGKQIVVTVSNNTAAELTGELAVATPVETWALGGHNPFAFADITPRTQKVTAPPDSRTEYIFDIVNRPFDMLPAFYAVAKLMVNGRIHFAYAREKGPLHNIWAHTFFHEIAADGGSIRKLLEM